MASSRWSAFAFVVLTCVAAYAQDFPLIREMELDGQTIIVDNTNTRLRIEVVDEFIEELQQADLARKLFKSYADAAAAVGSKYVLPSTALLYAKGKKFDDGMYAAVDLAAEADFGKLQIGKREFCQRVLKALEKRHGSLTGYPQQACEVAISYVGSALQAGAQLEERYQFPGVTLYDGVGRKPIGFYTWSDELFNIFRRDTALQERFGLDDTPQVFRKGQLDNALLVAAGAILAEVVVSDTALLAEYDRLNSLYARLTNPLNGLLVREVMAAVQGLGGLEAAIGSEAQAGALADKLGDSGKVGLALFQPSRSKEMALLWFAAAAGVSTMDALIDAIRDGSIDLKPDGESGWYEYQQYALEPLLLPDKMPEGEKLTLGEKYRKLLEEHFKSMISQIRETHLGQIEPPCDEAPPEELELEILPYLAVEPIATTYYRFADAYRFLNSVLVEELGPEARSDLHVLGEGALERDPELGDELDGMKRLMAGAYLLTCRDIGIKPELEGSSEELMATLAEGAAWLETWTADPDMARDVRMMIPVSQSPDAFWAVIGVKLTKLEVEFERTPEVRAEAPNVKVSPSFGSATYWVPTEKFIEVQFEGDPLNREEFRALCDQHKTEAEIMRALKGLGAVPAPQAQVARPEAAALQWILPTVVVIVGLALVIPELIKALRRPRG